MFGIQGFVAQAEQHREGLKRAEVDAFVDSMAALWRPILSNMGISGAMGGCSAAALKVVGRSLAAFMGLGFACLQLLTYHGYVSVNWTKVSEHARAALDTTRDGRLDANDYKRALKNGLVVLSQGLPSTSGFLLGFTFGLRFF
ncbi:MAG: hypothetical protein J3K34DRAFT_444513 [Monoraphidium minutum]|nr:MAG: hypothetical protein J3K34DRAFT_444513 [Monoraphidium minutum]